MKPVKIAFRYACPLVLGVIIGLMLTYGAQTLKAQAPPPPLPLITASGNFHMCPDYDQRDLALTVSVDGAQAVPAVGVIWEPNGSLFTAKIPLAKQAPQALTFGDHAVLIQAPGTAVTLADGSIVTIPGGELTVSYRVIDIAGGKPPVNFRWLRLPFTSSTLKVITGVVVGFIFGHWF